MGAFIVETIFLATLNVNKPAASFVFTSKIGLPRVVPVLPAVGLISSTDICLSTLGV